MSEFPASKAGSGHVAKNDRERSDSGRRKIYVDGPPAHAGIVAALRTAFCDGARASNDEHEFADLLQRLN